MAAFYLLALPPNPRLSSLLFIYPLSSLLPTISLVSSLLTTSIFFSISTLQNLKQFPKMPVENLEEEGLPKNPNLDLAQWRYTLTAPHGMNKQDVAIKLLNPIKQNG